MNPRRSEYENLETARQQLAEAPAAATEQTQEEPARKKGSRSSGVLAGALYSRLNALDADEQAELAASPTDIRAKFEGRRVKILGEASEEVRELVERMRAK